MLQTIQKVSDQNLEELDSYKLICPIGAESLKYTAGMTGIQKYNGIHIEKKYLPIMHPNMIVFKPQLQEDICAAFGKIKPILSDENLHIEVEKNYVLLRVLNIQKILTFYRNTLDQQNL